MDSPILESYHILYCQSLKEAEVADGNPAAAAAAAYGPKTSKHITW